MSSQPPAPSPSAVNDLSEILSALTTPDTATVRRAEHSLRSATSSSSCVLPLVALSCGAPLAHTRQLACVLLRKAVLAHWAALTPAQRATVKATLLERLPAEEAAAPRRAIAAAAAAVCRVTEEIWPELVQTAAGMAGVAGAEGVFVRVGAFKVFEAVAEAVPRRLVGYAGDVCGLVAGGLGDPDAGVRMAALETFGTVASAVSVFAEEEEAWRAVGGLVPAVAGVARGTAEGFVGGKGVAVDGDELCRVLIVVFDVFSMLAESGGGAVMKPHFGEVFRFALDVAAPTGMPQAARQAAVEYLCSCLHSKPKTLKKAELVKATLHEAFRMALLYRRSDSDELVVDEGDGDGGGDEGEDADDEGEEVNGFDLALRLVYVVASRGELSRFAFGEVMGAVPQLFAGNLAPFALSRPVSSPHHPTTVAFRLIAAVADGCSADVTKHMEDILGRLAAGAVDASMPARTRASAMEGVAHVISALDVNEVDDDVRGRCAEACLNAVLTAMRDPSLAVKRNACIALEPVLDLFDDDGQVLRDRVSDVLGALDGLGAAAAIEAVSAAAVVADKVGSEFVSSNAYRGVVEGMAVLMARTGDADVAARAAATQAASSVISSCPNWQVAERLSSLAIQGFSIEDPALSEATYIFFAKMADTHGGPVAFGFGAQVLQLAIASANREDVIFTQDPDEAGGLFGGEAGGNDEPGGFDADDTMGSFGVRTALLDEKCAATRSIGSFATAVATKEFFELASSATGEAAANAEKIISLLTAAGSCLDPMVTYFHEDIRAAGTAADVAYAVAASKAPHVSPKLAFGPADATQRTVERLVHTLEEDDDVFVVTVALHACAEFCTAIGPSILVQFKDRIVLAIEKLVQGEATCQLSSDQLDDLELEYGGGGRGADGNDDAAIDEGDDVATLIDGVCEAMSAMSRSLRGHFIVDFAKLLPGILEKLLSSSSAPRNVAIVVGMFADIFLFLNWKRCENLDVPAPGSPEALATQSQVGELASRVFPVAVACASGKRGSSKSLQRNAVFLVGVLYGATPPGANVVWNELPSMLQLFEAMITQGKEHDGALVDNAVGAVARVMNVEGLPANAVGSMRNALHLLLSAVPIEDDPTENSSVARAVVTVAKSGDLGALEMMADSVVSCLVSAIVLSMEQEEALPTVRRMAIEADPNDKMARLSLEERGEMIQLLKEVRAKCGDGCLQRLRLDPEDQSRMAKVLS